jgi:hygromycin-B 4-O-kinase
LPPALAAALSAAEKTIGGGFELSAIPGGDDSQVFRLQRGDCSFILRLNRSAAGFQKDEFVYRRFARPELPIPGIIQLGQAEGEFFCLSEAAPGRTLQDLSPHELTCTLEPAARALGAIAESTLGEGMTGYGPFNSTGIAPYRTWHDFLVDLLDPAGHDPIANRFLSLANRVPETRALIHGDFGSNNVLTQDGRITGVIDWSEAMFGDQLYDIANIFFWRTWLDCMEQPAAYFERNLPLDEAQREHLLCYQLRIGLNEIRQNLTDNDRTMANWALSRCQQLIR